MFVVDWFDWEIEGGVTLLVGGFVEGIAGRLRFERLGLMCLLNKRYPECLRRR